MNSFHAFQSLNSRILCYGYNLTMCNWWIFEKNGAENLENPLFRKISLSRRNSSTPAERQNSSMAMSSGPDRTVISIKLFEYQWLLQFNHIWQHFNLFKKHKVQAEGRWRQQSRTHVLLENSTQLRARVMHWRKCHAPLVSWVVRDSCTTLLVAQPFRFSKCCPVVSSV